MSRLGKYGISPGFDILTANATRRQLNLDRSVQAGANFVRFDCDPSWVTQCDAVVNDALARGLDVILTIYDTTGPTSAGTFGTDMATRYLGKVSNFEIANEPDLNGWTPNDYADFVAVVSDQIRAVQPDANIIAGALWKGDGLGTSNDPKAFTVALCTRAAGKFNLLSMHLYDDPNVRADWNIWDWALEWGGSGYCDNGTHGGTVRRALNNNGHFEVPIISTEGGGPLWDDVGHTSAAYTTTEQANIVAHGIAQVEAGRLAAYSHFQVLEDDLRQFSLRDGSDIARPSWTSYQNGVHKFLPKFSGA